MCKKIAALFVQKQSCYKDIEFVDCWDIDRDARLYSGPYPVVAHPPCQLWGALAFVNYSRWGGIHNIPGNDGGCFYTAFNNVNKYGGVLEHPKKSNAWRAFGLKKPEGRMWIKSGKGWVCEVWQSAYGHKANKATWLYFVGNKKPYDLNFNNPKGTHQIGFYDQRGKHKNKPTLNKHEANATPELFRNALLKLAEYSLS